MGERLGIAFDDVGILVCLDANAMAGSVHEVRTETRIDDALPGGTIDVLTRRAHRGGAHRSSLGLVEDRIRFEVFAVGAIVGPNVASDVGAVADAIVADHRAAEIAEHRFASLDDALTGVMMRTGGVLPGGDDGEIHAVMALLENLASEFGRDRRLGLPDERDLATLQPGGDPIDGGPGFAKTGDLLGVLHLPDRARDGRCPAKRGVGHLVGEIDEKARPHVVTDGDRVGGAGEVGDLCDRILGFAPWRNREDLGPLVDTGAFEARDDKRGVALPRHDEHGDAFERHRLVAAEVRKVAAHRQHEHVDAVGLHAGPGSVQASCEHVG